MPIQPIWPIFKVNRLNWQYFFAGSSKTAPRILIFSIVMGDGYTIELFQLRPMPPNLLDILKVVILEEACHVTGAKFEYSSLIGQALKIGA